MDTITIRPSFCRINNFGDELNELFARSVFAPRLGNQFHSDPGTSDVKIYAIGSYLSYRFLNSLNAQNRAIVVGMGAGYDDFPVEQSYGFGSRFPVWIKNNLRLPLPRNTPAKSPFHHILWVRGPLTARLLGLGSKSVVGDAGYLIRKTGFLQKSLSITRSGIGFLPHYTAACSSPKLKEISESVGLRYIDPRAGYETVLNLINQCESVITEALHGAIVCDALRVPWVPVKSSDDIFKFKWLDFCASIGINYNPKPIDLAWHRAFYNGRNPRSLVKNITTRLRSLASRIQIRPEHTAIQLIEATSIPPILSGDTFIKQIDQQMDKKLDLLEEMIQKNAVFD